MCLSKLDFDNSTPSLTIGGFQFRYSLLIVVFNQEERTAVMLTAEKGNLGVCRRLSGLETDAE